MGSRSPHRTVARLALLATLAVLVVSSLPSLASAASLHPVPSGTSPARPGSIVSDAHRGPHAGLAARPDGIPACSALAPLPAGEVPAVLATEQAPCPRGGDASMVSFYNGSGASAERFRANLTLPSGTDAGRILRSIFVGVWVGGIPCSYQAKSFLEVALLPPFAGPGVAPSANWSVLTPLFGLTPVASCDPACQNDSATLTIQGRLYCDDQLSVVPSARTPVAPRGGFAPGDAVSVDVVGVTNGTSGLTLYVNDTSRPGRNLLVNWGPTSTRQGRPVTPFFVAAANTSTGWGYAGPVSIGWNGCPSVAGSAACNSYDGSLLGAIGSPRVTRVAFWDPATGQYSRSYAFVQATSSSTGCTRPVGAGASCADFRQFGGTGAYPNWTLTATAGQVAWQATAQPPGNLDPFGGGGSEYVPDNLSTPIAPLGLTFLQDASTGTRYVNLSVVVGAPDGVAAVAFDVLGCSSSSSPVVIPAAGTRGGGPGNTTQFATWSASLTLPGYPGRYPYWVRAETSAGSWSPPRYGNATVGGTLAACNFGTVAAPVYSASNVTAVAGGYALTWSEATPGVASFAIYLNATTGGAHLLYTTGPARSAVLRPGLGGLVYDVAISATTLTGNTSATGGTAVGPTTLATIGITLSSVPLVLIAPSLMATVTATIVGGAPPYNVSFDFGDGSGVTLTDSGPLASTSHTFAVDAGVARVGASVVDARGDVAVAPVDLFRVVATPLGVNASLAAGDSFVVLAWAAPASPGGAITHYAVLYAEGATSPLDLSATWPNNGTLPGTAHIWNTTRLTLVIPANDGVVFSARVIAFNVHGAGGLFNGTQFVSAVPAPLTVGPIVAAPGGSAPFLDSFSTLMTTGTNNSISQAIYSFTGGAFVYAQVAGGNGTFWANATRVFAVPGLIAVTLHVVDAFNDVAIVTTDIVVVAGAGPSVSVTLTTGATPALFVGEHLSFVPTVTGGSGNYSYLWEFGDGTVANATTPSHVYGNSGNFTVRLTVLDNVTGGGTVWTGSVTIFAIPTVVISTTQGPNGSFSYVFSAFYFGGSGVTSFAWSFSDGATSGGVRVGHAFPGPGRYTVNVTAIDVPSGRSANASVVLVVGSVAAGSSTTPATAYIIAIAVLAGLAAFGLLGWAVEKGKGPGPPLTAEEEAATRDPFPVGERPRELPSGDDVVIRELPPPRE
ncbi:MAG: PKD domain-containing protein [Thermoplasmata archaeon]|nr:PKD domain-containing protein [Thermoplasmata archaeon]